MCATGEGKGKQSFLSWGCGSLGVKKERMKYKGARENVLGERSRIYSGQHAPSCLGYQLHRSRPQQAEIKQWRFFGKGISAFPSLRFLNVPPVFERKNDIAKASSVVPDY